MDNESADEYNGKDDGIWRNKRTITLQKRKKSSTREKRDNTDEEPEEKKTRREKIKRTSWAE